MTSHAHDHVRPEGGWGWAVVVGCFVNQMLFEGLVRSYGFVYLALQDQFHGSAVATSWIQACFSGIALALGPLASVLTERYSCRTVVMCGGALISLALVLSSFTPNLYFLYFSYSFLGGIGGSLIYSPMFIIVSQYFDRKRGMALGISSLGSAVGTYTIPTLVTYLVNNYGYEGCLLIQAGIMLNHCVSGCLYRPIKPRDMAMNIAEADALWVNIDDLNIDDDVVPNKLCDSKGTKSVGDLQRPLSAIPPHLQTSTYYSDGALDKNGGKKSIQNGATKEYLFPNTSVRSGLNQRSKPTLAESINVLFESAMSLTFVLTEDDKPRGRHSISRQSSDVPLANEREITVKVVVNGDALTTSSLAVHNTDTSITNIFTSKLSIMRNPSYIFFCFELFALSSTILPNFVFLPPLAKEKGLTDKHISILLGIIGMTGFVGTFVIGLIFDTERVRSHKRLFYASLAIFQGIATVCMALAPGFAAMVVAASCIGFVITSLIGQRANATSHYVTAEQLPFAFGIVTMFQGFGNLIGPAIQGLLKDRFDTYKPCFYFGGGILILSSLIVIADYTFCVLLDQSKRNREKRDTKGVL